LKKIIPHFVDSVKVFMPAIYSFKYNQGFILTFPKSITIARKAISTMVSKNPKTTIGTIKKIQATRAMTQIGIFSIYGFLMFLL